MTVEGPVSASSAIGKILVIDQARIGELTPILDRHGLMPILNRISGLFEELPAATQAASSGKNPYVRETPDGPTRAWDFVLRVFMAQSAHAQFLHAVGHLLRGHSFEIFGHARTMIENSGIALLSTTQPDIADVYLDIERRDEFKRRTGSRAILPPANPLTADLNEDFAIASRTFHSNFVAVAGRTATQFVDGNDGRITFTNAMKFHDSDPGDPNWLLRHAGWLARVACRCLRVLGSTLGLIGSAWLGKLDALECDLRSVLEPLAKVLFPLRDAEVK